MRTNVYRDKIVKLLEQNHLLSIADIHKKIVGADYSTIYRNIKQLVLAGQIKKVVLGKDNVVYEVNKKTNQHDHFLCLECGDIEEVKGFSGKLLSANHKVVDVLVRGLCGNCNKI